MYTYKGLNTTNNKWNPAAIDDYRENITYDANGNILTYKRFGDAARTTQATPHLLMDDLTYSYAKAGTNRLTSVADAAADASSVDYPKYNDIKRNQATDNYGYDKIGNLVIDKSENIYDPANPIKAMIEWTVYGKIKTITKIKTGVATTISYSYDASGNRISKKVNNDCTYYVRDASGNVMSIYEKSAATTNSLVQTEVHLYGSSRLGILTANVNVSQAPNAVPANGINTFTRGLKRYELTNHLDNVLVTISDRKLLVTPQGSGSTNCMPGTGVNVLNVYARATESMYVASHEINFLPPFTINVGSRFIASINRNLGPCISTNPTIPAGSYYIADVITAGDYYPGGMPMPGRTFTQANTNYLYGFNGQEKSDEIAGNGNHNTAEYWEYDTRLGRRWNLDPKPQFGISEYACFNNNPIFFNDVTGDIVKVHVGNKVVGYTMINLFSSKEVKKGGHKQIKVKVPVYQVTITNESGKSSTFLYTRYNLRANVDKKNAIEDRTFDVNKDGDSFDGVVKSRWGGKNNVLEVRKTGRANDEDQSGVIGMKGDVSNVERVAIQFHVLGASDGCLLSVGSSNLLEGSTATSSFSNSTANQTAFMSTVQSYQKEDKKNGFSNNINIAFDRLHDNPNYSSDVGGEVSNSGNGVSANSTSSSWHPPMAAPSNSTPNYVLPLFLKGEK